MKYKVIKMEDALDALIDYRGKTPKKSENGVLTLSAKSVKNNYIDYSQCYFISKEEYKRFMVRGLPQKGDILLTTEAPLGMVARLDRDDVAIAQRLLTLRGKKDVLDNDYLLYYLQSPLGQASLKARETGTTVTGIKQSEFRKIELKLPAYKIQKKISGILRAIDDKIELNNAINNNLLEQALTLYASQFAKLDRNGCIGDYCSVKSGFAFKSSWWTKSGVKVIKIGSINQDNLNLLECSYVDEDKIVKAKDFKVGAGDLLIAMTGATIGKFAMVPYSSETLLVNQRVGKFFLGDNPVERLPFIYCTLKQPDVYYEIVNRGQGSAQPNISASEIMSTPCVIPSDEVLSNFNATVQPLFDLIISNQQANQYLSELRDSLLPKLMSGELDVSNIDL